MKKLLQILSSAVLLGAVMTGTAAAQQNCSISNTGQNSNNTCTVTSNNTVTVNCTNGVTVTNNNFQTANSGTATVSGNTISGTATSGDASNINTTANELASYCAAAPAAANPPAGGQGGGTPEAAATPEEVTSLPKTGADDTARNIGLAVVVTSVLGLGSHLAVSGYRRFSLKG